MCPTRVNTQVQSELAQLSVLKLMPDAEKSEESLHLRCTLTMESSYTKPESQGFSFLESPLQSNNLL